MMVINTLHQEYSFYDIGKGSKELWHILQDFKSHSKLDPALASVAKQHLAVYKFPVMMLISFPNGSVIHSLNANDLLDMQSSLLDQIQ